MGLLFTIAAGRLQHSLSQIRVPRDSWPHFTLLVSRARSPYLYTPGTGRPDYTPRHWIPFPSPRTTDRATVEVFDPASRLQSSTVFSSYIAYPNPRKLRLITCTPYPWTRLVITQRRAVFQESISMETCFAHSFPGSGSTCHIVSKNSTDEKNWELRGSK
jgi:hypothetical protein